MAVVREDQVKPVAGDDAGEVCWAKVSAEHGGVQIRIGDDCINQEMAFDHYEIISDAIEKYHKH